MQHPHVLQPLPAHLQDQQPSQKPCLSTVASVAAVLTVIEHVSLCCLLQSHAASGLIKRFGWVRNRMIADDKFLFKVLAEVVIDSGTDTTCGSREHFCFPTVKALPAVVAYSCLVNSSCGK